MKTSTIFWLTMIPALMILSYAKGYEDGERSYIWIPAIPQVCDGRVVG